jgi:hypothetical protein
MFLAALVNKLQSARERTPLAGSRLLLVSFGFAGV